MGEDLPRGGHLGDPFGRDEGAGFDGGEASLG